MKPEDKARIIIDQKLVAAGWIVVDKKNIILAQDLVLLFVNFKQTLDLRTIFFL